MKKLIVSGMLALLATTAVAQSGNDDRMERDIQVAENVLGSLIKQQIGDNVLMPVEVEGSYRPGLGITFSVPNNSLLNWIVVPRAPRAPSVKVYGGQGNGYSYTIETDEDGDIVTEEIHGGDDHERERSDKDKARSEEERAKSEKNRAMSEEQRAKVAEGRARSAEGQAAREFERSWGSMTVTGSADAAEKDSKEYNKFLIEAAKTFLADYSTILSQLKTEERITITNRANEGGNRYWRFMGDEKRFFLSIEAAGADIKQYQAGKLTREQFISKIKVVESEVDAERSQDLELLNTIFDRLYQPDLSRTFFTEDNTYYERLKDYGAVFYMQVFSSNQMDRGYYNMPTQKIERVTQEERDKKVTELYPAFEKELKENMLEYGRTLRSLKPDESLVFNVKLTKCVDCGIPATLEVSVKASVLNDYMLGKLEKNAALAKMDVKKGAQQ